jgi:hypothetical protein
LPSQGADTTCFTCTSFIGRLMIMVCGSLCSSASRAAAKEFFVRSLRSFRRGRFRQRLRHGQKVEAGKVQTKYQTGIVTN